MTDRDDDALAERISAFRLRRSWPNMIAMFIGGWSAFIGLASIGAHVTRHGHENALSMASAGTLYLLSVGLYAWGAARFEARAWPRWFVLTTLSAGVLIAVAMLARFIPIVHLLVGRLVGPLSGSGFAEKSDLVTLLADDQTLTRLLGGSPGPPTIVFSRARSSSAIWRASQPSGTHSPIIGMTVREDAALAWRTRKAAVKPPSSATRALGRSGIITRGQAPDGEYLNLTQTRRGWVVNVTGHGAFATDPEPDLLRLAAGALDRLDRDRRTAQKEETN